MANNAVSASSTTSTPENSISDFLSVNCEEVDGGDAIDNLFLLRAFYDAGPLCGHLHPLAPASLHFQGPTTIRPHPIAKRDRAQQIDIKK
jgi:hypothetical protein